MHRLAHNSGPLRCAGFTLVETIATLAVTGVLAVVSSRLVLDAADAYTASVARARLCSEMSSALERLTIELRSVPLEISGVPAGPNLTGISGTSISWNDASGVRTLALDGSSLISTESGVESPLLHNVSALALRALDDEHEPLALPLSGSACRAARRLEITVTCERAGVEETLRTLVFLRAAMAGSNP